MNGELPCPCECCLGLPERNRAIAEKAWDEGHQGGMADEHRDWMVPEILERHINPYISHNPS